MNVLNHWPDITCPDASEENYKWDALTKHKPFAPLDRHVTEGIIRHVPAGLRTCHVARREEGLKRYLPKMMSSRQDSDSALNFSSSAALNFCTRTVEDKELEI